MFYTHARPTPIIFCPIVKLLPVIFFNYDYAISSQNPKTCCFSDIVLAVVLQKFATDLEAGLLAWGKSGPTSHHPAV